VLHLLGVLHTSTWRPAIGVGLHIWALGATRPNVFHHLIPRTSSLLCMHILHRTYLHHIHRQCIRFGQNTRVPVTSDLQVCDGCSFADHFNGKERIEEGTFPDRVPAHITLSSESKLGRSK
jgi:hypothetical protein